MERRINITDQGQQYDLTPQADLLRQILQPNNLQAAWRAVKANKGGPGVDGKTIDETRQHLRQHWAGIAEKLRAGNYQSAAIKAVSIPKAGGGERTLGIPTVQDRLIQQAILQVLSPIFDVTMSEHSYGFRPNKSAHQAVTAARNFVKGGKTWVIDIDLKNFFDQVNHDKLMHLVSRKVGDKTLLKLIGGYLRAPLQHADGTRQPRTRGTPQGGPISPLLANIILDPLDKELERRGVSFVRYADDIAIFVSSQRAGERILASVIAWLERHLGLEVNHDKSGVGPVEKSALLGFRLHRDGEISIAPKAITRLKERVKELWDARLSRTRDELRQQWRNYIDGWWNYFQLSTQRWNVTALGGWIRRHMRKCFWLRWHNPKGRRNALARLGVTGRALGVAACRRGAWPMARHVVVQQALKTKTLTRYGLGLPWDLQAA
jgi:RNA-directed DNA polymerase